MNLKNKIIYLSFFLLLCACADYKVNKSISKTEKSYHASIGFALIYEDSLLKQKIVNRKLNNDKFETMHNFLKTNTPIRIVNPINSKFLETKVYKKGDYPKIFNIVITKEIASILELDVNDPYVEILEIKKNKTFIAKKSNTFDEEKNVVVKVPVDEVQMDDLSKKKNETTEIQKEKTNYILLINDFYYADSANNLKNELFKKTKINNISVKKINNNKYRLFVGPFENFNALKTTYISLNNLGFENLNIYKE